MHRVKRENKDCFVNKVHCPDSDRWFVWWWWRWCVCMHQHKTRMKFTFFLLFQSILEPGFIHRFNSSFWVLVTTTNARIQLQTPDCLTHTLTQVYSTLSGKLGTSRHRLVRLVVLPCIFIKSLLKAHLLSRSWLRFSSQAYTLQAHPHTHPHTCKHLNRPRNNHTCASVPGRLLSNLFLCQLHIHGWTRRDLKENHNRSEALSDHLTSAQHPFINRKTGSAPQGRKQHLENRLKWELLAWRWACTSVCGIVLWSRVSVECVHYPRFQGQTVMKL